MKECIYGFTHVKLALSWYKNFCKCFAFFSPSLGSSLLLWGSKKPNKRMQSFDGSTAIFQVYAAWIKYKTPIIWCIGSFFFLERYVLPTNVILFIFDINLKNHAILFDKNIIRTMKNWFKENYRWNFPLKNFCESVKFTLCVVRNVNGWNEKYQPNPK